MTPFTVDWDEEAEDELARNWMEADEPNEVVAAQNLADQLLSHDPVGAGRPLSEGLYLLLVPPLVVFYTIDTARRHVQVTWVNPSA